MLDLPKQGGYCGLSPIWHSDPGPGHDATPDCTVVPCVRSALRRAAYSLCRCDPMTEPGSKERRQSGQPAALDRFGLLGFRAAKHMRPGQDEMRCKDAGRPGRRKSATSGGDGPHPSHMASSFTDLMASLMVIFILLFVATLSNAAKRRETIMEMFLGALKSALAVGGMNPGGIRKDDRDPYAGGDRHARRSVVQRGEWTVQQNGQATLGEWCRCCQGLCAPTR